MPELETVSPDADLNNSDWTRQRWDLPAYKSPEFFQLIKPEDLDRFRQLPVYKHAVKIGLIFDDEWVLDHIQLKKDKP